MIAITQNNVQDNGLVSLDNVTISTSIFTSCLEVSYTRYGGIWRAHNLDLSVLLFLSPDNVSWIEVDNYTFDESNRESNVSKTFDICNSMIQPAPFDIEQGVTLFITLEYYYDTGWDTQTCRLCPIAIIVPIDIIRPWYFTIDWTLPGIFGLVFLCVFSIFLVSRYNRKQIEKEL
ncbi:MAG: hypothetical protein E4H14_17445 [Candidatus Thorarchaeota archaeon]|nr:MAG: hypothetical protein E4H14_17445 [Candidatus Thorarchaeota archaeon]